jgi:proline dehydrogenase
VFVADLDVPTGTIGQVMAWVGDDPDRAQAARDAETASDSPRSKLIDQADGVIAAGQLAAGQAQVEQDAAPEQEAAPEQQDAAPEVQFTPTQVIDNSYELVKQPRYLTEQALIKGDLMDQEFITVSQAQEAVDVMLQAPVKPTPLPGATG